MGGAASLATARTKFPLCVAADLYGRKCNVRLVFVRCPTLTQLLDAATLHFNHEAHALRPAGSPEHPFQVEQLHVYDPAARRWNELVETATLRPAAQIFAFQPRAATALGVSHDSPSIIPEAVGEATVLSDAPVVIEYSLEHKLRAVFLATDRGEKGYVIPADLHDALARAGMAWDYTLVSEYFTRINTSANGRVTYAQWARFGREHPEITDELFYRSRRLLPSGYAAPPSYQPPPPPAPSTFPQAGGAGSLYDPRATTAPPPPAPHTPGRAQPAQVAAVWRTLTAGKSYITYGDLRSAFLRAAQPWDRSTVGAWFAAADADSSGQVTWEEWWRFAQFHPEIVAELARGNPFPAPPSPRRLAAAPVLTPRSRATATAAWHGLSRGRGFVTYGDLRAGMLRAGLPWDVASVGRWFTAADADASGHITFDEWLRFAQVHKSAVDALSRADLPTPAAGSGGASTASTWQELAAGKDYITFADMRSAMYRAGLPWDYTTVGRWFHAADHDANGRITWDEWWYFCQEHPSVAAALSRQRDIAAAPAAAVTPRGAAPRPFPSPALESQVAAVWRQLAAGRDYVTCGDLRDAFLAAGQLWAPSVAGRWYAAAETDPRTPISWEDWWFFARSNADVVEGLAAYRSALPASVPMPLSPSPSTMALWNALSLGRGYATFDDLRAMFRRAGQPWDASSVGVWFHSADIDGNGRITLDEWLSFAHRHPSVIDALGRSGTGDYPGPHHDPLASHRSSLGGLPHRSRGYY